MVSWFHYPTSIFSLTSHGTSLESGVPVYLITELQMRCSNLTWIWCIERVTSVINVGLTHHITHWMRETYSVNFATVQVNHPSFSERTIFTLYVWWIVLVLETWKLCYFLYHQKLASANLLRVYFWLQLTVSYNHIVSFTVTSHERTEL